MLFDPSQVGLKKDVQLRAHAPIPVTGWTPPQHWPDLSDAAAIAIDTETFDPELLTAGPGWGRGVGHIVGFSVAARSHRNDRWKGYFPIRHTVKPEENLDPAAALGWLRKTLETPHIPKIGANLLYDVGWLAEEQIFIQGVLHDVQFAEAILDDTAFVALEVLAKKYLGEGKETNTLYQWITDTYKPNKSQVRANIYRSPPSLVGPYGEADADLPMRIHEQQMPLIEREGFSYVYRLECDLIRLLVRMRLQGVRVDLHKAGELTVVLGNRINEAYKALSHTYKTTISSVNSGQQLAKLFDANNVKYPRTEVVDGKGGNPSFRKEWLEALEHPLGDEINNIRKLEKCKGTFLEGYLLNKAIPETGGGNFGILRTSLHPLKDDENGAKTGRFASSDPNLQNIPVRTDEGKLIREAFVPFAGHKYWEKNDYSQIEYRMLAHFAVDDGDGSAQRLRQSYIDNPKTDYHLYVQENVKLLTGIEIPRRPIKNINFGLVYGQSQPSLAYKAGFTKEQSTQVFTAYHKGAPYVKPTLKAIAGEVQRDGCIRTIIGRRVSFPLWEPAWYDDEWHPALPFHMAINEYGSNIKRAGDYKGVNYKFQGSGTGDVIKVAMRACDQAGVFEYTGMPMLQVHDELDNSVPDAMPHTEAAYKEMRHILAVAQPCAVPIVVDTKRGANWGVID